MSTISVLAICVCAGMFVCIDGLTFFWPKFDSTSNATRNAIKKVLKDKHDKNNLKAEGCISKVNKNLKKKWERMFDYYNMKNDDRINDDDFVAMRQKMVKNGAYSVGFAERVTQLTAEVLSDVFTYLDDTTRTPEQGVTKNEMVMMLQKQRVKGTQTTHFYRENLYEELINLPGANGKLSKSAVQKFEMALGLDEASARKITDKIDDDLEINKMAYVNAYVMYFSDTSPAAALDKFPLFGDHDSENPGQL